MALKWRFYLIYTSDFNITDFWMSLLQNIVKGYYQYTLFYVSVADKCPQSL